MKDKTAALSFLDELAAKKLNDVILSESCTISDRYSEKNPSLVSELSVCVMDERLKTRRPAFLEYVSANRIADLELQTKIKLCINLSWKILQDQET